MRVETNQLLNRSGQEVDALSEAGVLLLECLDLGAGVAGQEPLEPADQFRVSPWNRMVVE